MASAAGGNAVVRDRVNAAVSSSRGVHTTQLGTLEARQGAASQPFYPAQYYKVTPEDDRAAIKHRLAADRNILGDVTVSDRDLEWIESKHRETTQLEYDRWFLQQYDLSNPAHLKIAREANPQVFERIVKVMDSYFDMAKRIGRMNVVGVHGMDDHYMKWLWESGRVQRPPAEFWNPGTNAGALFQPGIFNPRRRGADPANRGQTGILGATAPGGAPFNTRNPFPWTGAVQPVVPGAGQEARWPFGPAGEGGVFPAAFL